MKTIVVTGDSRGLGADIVRKILENNYNVIGISRNENTQVEAFHGEYPDRYSHINFDLSNPDSIRNLYQSKLKPQGPIFGVVNNAAAAYDDILTNADTDHLNHTFNVNVISAILLSKFAIRDMILHQTEGSLVHISSVSTSTGYKGLSMYAATKGALEAFSLGVAREWGERGIRSNCVAPGFMETDMTSNLTEDQKERIYSRTGLKESTDQGSVAESVLFLLKDDSKSITGETLRVDAGTL